MTDFDFKSLFSDYQSELSLCNDQNNAFAIKSKAITEAVDTLLDLSKKETVSENGLAHLYTYYKCICDLSLNLDSSIERMYVRHDRALEITNSILSFLNQLIALAGKSVHDTDLTTLTFNTVPSGIMPSKNLKSLQINLDENKAVVDAFESITLIGLNSLQTAKTNAGKVGAGIFTLAAGALTAMAAYAEITQRNEEIRKSFSEISTAIKKECNRLKKKITYTNMGFEKISLLQTTQTLFFTFFNINHLPSHVNTLLDKGTINNDEYIALTQFITKMNNNLSDIAAKQYSQHKETKENSTLPKLDYLARTSGSDLQDAKMIYKRLNKILNSLPETLNDANKTVDQRRQEHAWNIIKWILLVVIIVVILVFLIPLLWSVLTSIFSILGTIVSFAFNVIKEIFSFIKNLFSKSVLTSILSILGTIANTAFDVIKEIFSFIKNLFSKSVLTSIFSILGTIANTAFDVIKEIFSFIKELFSVIFS